MRNPVFWGTALLLIWAFTVPAYAQDIMENSGPAKINWTKKEMVFTGDGAVSLKDTNAASSRLGAERAAQLVALRNALEALKGVRITAGTSVDDKFKKDTAISAKIEGIIRNFIVSETRYYADGGVQRDLVISLDGELGKALLKDETKKQPAQKQATPPVDKKPAQNKQGMANKVTGLVVVAKGFKVIPVLAPKIIDEKGKDVYDVTMVSEAALDGGIVHYAKDETSAVGDKKVVGNPLVITATHSPNAVDLVISDGDAQKIRQVASLSPFLAEGRVIIVKD